MSVKSDGVIVMEEREEPLQTCMNCDGVIEGSFQGIKLSVCCADCCAKTTTDRGYYTMVGKRAVRELRCKHKDLARLDHKAKYLNPFGYPSKLYLFAEVQQLGKLRRQAEKKAQAEKEAKYRPALIKRKRKLLKALDLTTAEFANEKKRVAMIFLTGDHMKRWRPKTKLKDVQERWKVFSRVEEILRRCPKADPDAAFDFCLSHPHAGADEFLEAKQSIQKAFHLFGDRILYYLERLDFELPSFLDTPLEEEYLHYMGRYKRSIRCNLLKHVSPSIADEIMIHPSSLKYIQRGTSGPRVADKLVNAWNERCGVKRKRAKPKKASRKKSTSTAKRQRK